MNFQEIRALLTEHFKGRLAKAKADMAEAGRLGPLDRASYANTAELADEALREKWPLMVTAQADSEWMSRLIERYGLKVQPGTDGYELLRTETMRAHRDFCSAILEHDNALEHYDYTDATHKVANLPATDAATDIVALDELAKRFTAESNRGEQWASKTQSDKLKHIDLLFEILGKNIDTRRISASDAQRVKDVLTRYPKNRQKNPRTRNRPLSEVLEITDVDKLDVRTLNKYLQTYASMFRWARRNNYVQENYFDGLAVRRGNAKGSVSKQAFSASQIAQIQYELLYNEKGLVRLEYQKWGPLIALYTGARLNEIAQIHLSDIRSNDGIWCFDLNDNDESKTLKTAASRRLVPIHSRLIELGILQYVQTLRAAGETKLFPSFEFCPKNGWGRSLGRWFNNQFLVKLGIKAKGLSFHTFRHTVVTQLLRTGVNLEVVQTIVGHERQGVTLRTYFGAGHTLEKVRSELERLHFAEGPASADVGR